ncbi:uncharacterized protein LOC119105393 [Pollicipes pollicipes]|uniref:uncharacterized protein LOC119105393 n=1 Tax=Pollicipes pollicipes TaxID=41117 RepID=UPI0018852022|nr:uncharacterized protein LOC119105393 [Pollicipes pollicipes]
MYEGGSCSDLSSGGPLDLKRGQLMTSRLGAAPHAIKEELAGAVEWPAGCGYRLPSWGAGAPFDPLKSSVDRVKMAPPELGRERSYFSPGLYLGRDSLAACPRDMSEQEKRMTDKTPLQNLTQAATQLTDPGADQGVAGCAATIAYQTALLTQVYYIPVEK